MTYVKREATQPNNLTQYREDRLMTQKQLASKAGVGLRTLNSLEQGCRCRPETAEKILKALNLPLRRRKEVFPWNWSGVSPMA